MPVKDARDTVDEAVASTLADLPHEAELIVVDDRCRDGTSEKLQEWARRDARVKVVEGPGRGISAALNAGLSQCRAPLVARMDADDVWLTGRWAAQNKAMREVGLAAVGGRVEIFGAGELRDGMRHYQAWLDGLHASDEIYRDRYVESPLVHPATLIRKSALEAVGGWREGDFPEDYALWLALLERGLRLGSVTERVLRWRDSGHRLTRTDARYRLEAHAALKAEHLAREPFVKGGVRLAGAGPTGLRLARLLRARGVAIRGYVEVHPRKIGQRIEGVEVVGYESLGAPDGVHLLVAVGAKGGRQQVREFLEPRGWLETRDFTCVA
ncbi:MAG: glycosyltransferase [Deltaproteobacteria bacterium]|nr:glycosyltransferase [Deltaproteobacteria bacterium]